MRTVLSRPRNLSGVHYGFLLLLVFGISSLFYASVWPEAPVVARDSPGYMDVAVDLQDFALDELHTRTPGYPLILLLTGSGVKPSRSLFYLQLISHFLAILLLVAVLHRLNISKKLIAVFIAISLLPYNVVPTAYVLSGTVAQFLLVIASTTLIVWLDRGQWLWLLASSFTLALSGITRPTYQMLSVVIIALLLLLFPFLPQLRRRLSVATIAIFLFACVIVGGLVLFNYRSFQYAGTTPNLGFNLSTRTVRVVERLPEEYSEIREILIAYRDKELIMPHSSHTAGMYIWGAIPELQETTNLSRTELSSYMLRLNLLLIQRAPLEYLQECAHALSSYWFPSTTDLSNLGSRFIQLLWTLLHFSVTTLFFAQTLLLTSLGILYVGSPPGIRSNLLGPVMARQKLQWVSIILAMVIILYTMILSTAIEVGNPRYRTPTDLLILFATLLGFDLWLQIRRRLQSLDELVEVRETLKDRDDGNTHNCRFD